MDEEKITEIQAGASEGPINVPIYRGTGFLVSSASTDSVVTILSLVPGINNGEFGAGAAPTAAFTLSHHALKELAALLADQVVKVEETHGNLSTPWLTDRTK